MRTNVGYKRKTTATQRSWKTAKWQDVSFCTLLGVSKMMYATLSLNFSRKLSWKLSWCQRGFILSAVWPFILNAMVIACSKKLTRRKFAKSQHHNSDLKWKIHEFLIWGCNRFFAHLMLRKCASRRRNASYTCTRFVSTVSAATCAWFSCKAQVNGERRRQDMEENADQTKAKH